MTPLSERPFRLGLYRFALAALLLVASVSLFAVQAVAEDDRLDDAAPVGEEAAAGDGDAGGDGDSYGALAAATPTKTATPRKTATPTKTPTKTRTPTKTATPRGTATPTQAVAASPTPALEPADDLIRAPGRVEAENYRPGGPGVGFSDVDRGNNGGVYRADDVDIATCADGSACHTVGWVRPGEWLAYNLDIAAAGNYTFVLRTAAPAAQRLSLRLDGAALTTVAVPATGSFAAYTDVAAGPVSLPAGVHTLAVVFDTGYHNLNHITITAAAGAPPAATATPTKTSTPAAATPTKTSTPASTATRTPTPTSGSGLRQKMIVPAYFPPGSEWTRLANDLGADGIAVMNIAVGPGTSFGAWEQAYRAQMQAVQAKDLRVIGYVRTYFGDRPINEIFSEIDRWYSWYTPDGIFLDEGWQFPDKATYYKQIYDYIKAKSGRGNLVVLSMGAIPRYEGLMERADILTTLEESCSYYVNPPWPMPAWLNNYSPDRVYHLIYGCSSISQMQSTIALSKQRRVGYVHVTNLAPPNWLWGSFPSGAYWEAQLAAIRTP